MARILLVEDEADLADAARFQLEKAGHVVQHVLSGEAALQALAGDVPDLVLLDLMLPGLSGKEVVRQLRADPRTARLPVIMTTALAEEVDRIVGFELGADDYVVKPYSLRELKLRVDAVLRRAATPAAEADGGEVLEFGVLRLELDAYRVFVGGEEIKLTRTEYNLLKTLLERRGRVQSRETLLTDVWGMSADVTSRTVDTHVKRLRQRLGAAADYVETLRGVGYRFRDRP